MIKGGLAISTECKGAGRFCHENEPLSLQPIAEQKVAAVLKVWLGSCLRPGMRLGMGKMHRSAVYYLINTVTPINHASKAELDTFGSVIVVVLLLGIVSLVRLILGWT
jgi:hypothetical protein